PAIFDPPRRLRSDGADHIALAVLVIGIEMPLGKTDEGGTALDGGNHRAIAGDSRLAHDAAREGARTEQTFGLVRLADLDPAAAFQHRQHGRGAGAARRTVHLAVAIGMDAAIERARTLRRLVEGH